MTEYQPTASELFSFCNGMHQMYLYAREINPDLVLFPLRGAQPFAASYTKIAALKEEPTPDFLLLPLGTCTDIERKVLRGLTKPEKERVVERNLDVYFAAKPSTRRVLLVDEVMNGGTILEHHHLVSKYLQERYSDSELRTCGIENGSHEPRGRYKNRAAKHGFYRVRVDTLFVMDREQFLPKVRLNGDFSVEIEEGKLEAIMEHVERNYNQIFGVN